jgi:hypothetical protein
MEVTTLSNSTISIISFHCLNAPSAPLASVPEAHAHVFAETQLAFGAECWLALLKMPRQLGTRLACLSCCVD